METLSVAGPDGRRFEIPVAVGFTADGLVVHELSGDVEPQFCTHAGFAWSDCLDLRCGACGARLFLPSSILAGLGASTIERMADAWEAAGCPSYVGRQWPTGERWVLVPHPLFDMVGGLPVLAARYERFLSQYLAAEAPAAGVDAES